MALFENTMKAFSPFAAAQKADKANDDEAKTAEGGDQDALRELKEQVDLLQRQLERLSAQDTHGGKKEID